MLCANKIEDKNNQPCMTTTQISIHERQNTTTKNNIQHMDHKTSSNVILVELSTQESHIFNLNGLPLHSKLFSKS